MIAPIVLLIVPLISGIMVWKVRPTSRKSIKLLLAFSGAYLLGLSVLHLIPEVYADAPKVAGFSILAGFVIQLLLEFLSGGIEHGHFHHHSKNERHFPIALIISLVLHSFLECLPLSQGHAHHVDSGFGLVAGISIHNIPVGITLMSILIQSGLERRTILLSYLAFSVAGPVGYFTGYFGSQVLQDLSSQFYQMSTGVVVGIFLHVSTTILFESGEGHRFNLFKLASIVVGSALAYLAIM
ncbi:MAG TPA: ZIP family metal transporter [Luteibaculaceae bacterium]|nr:ZIP family metal transporter [Luteibaculaceae bacterium]